MSFSTLPFLFYFLPAFLAVYYIVPARFRNAVLALGSLLFYWLGAGTGALLVLVALILVNFAAGRLIEFNRKRREAEALEKEKEKYEQSAPPETAEP